MVHHIRAPSGPNMVILCSSFAVLEMGSRKYMDLPLINISLQEGIEREALCFWTHLVPLSHLLISTGGKAAWMVCIHQPWSWQLAGIWRGGHPPEDTTTIPRLSGVSNNQQLDVGWIALISPWFPFCFWPIHWAELPSLVLSLAGESLESPSTWLLCLSTWNPFHLTSVTFSSIIIAAAAFLPSLFEAKRKQISTLSSEDKVRVKGKLFLHQSEDLTLSCQPYIQVTKKRQRKQLTCIVLVRRMAGTIGTKESQNWEKS